MQEYGDWLHQAFRSYSSQPASARTSTQLILNYNQLCADIHEGKLMKVNIFKYIHLHNVLVWHSSVF